MNSGAVDTDKLLEEEEHTIIIDIGQGSTKIGFAGDEKPRYIFPTVIGKPKYQNTMMTGMNTKEIYVGDDTKRMRGVLKLEYPIKRGVVQDWNHYYAILNHIFFNSLRVDSKKCNVIYLVPPLTPPETYQYFARVLFETHQCKSVAIVDSATTSIFSVGETTGLSIELGSGITTICPVMEGRIYDPSIQRLNLAGIDIENQLEQLLNQYGIFKKREIIKEIKEKTLKISLDPNKDAQDPLNDVLFTLPDGESLKVSANITIMASEIIFNPILIGISGKSLPMAIMYSLKSVDPYYWRPLLKKIVLSGGTSFIKGLKERLEMEIKKKLHELGELPPIQDGITKLEENQEPTNEDPKKMIQYFGKDIKQDNCPKCGELLEKGSDFCAFCGISIAQAQIEIFGTIHQTFPTICSKCFQKLSGTASVCPYCNKKLKPIIKEDKLDRKEKKLLKKTAVSDEELAKLSFDVENEYGDFDDLELNNGLNNSSARSLKDSDSDSEKLINILIPDDRIYAAFKGASILGSLESFKPFFINREKFEANPDSVKVDFYKVLKI